MKTNHSLPKRFASANSRGGVSLIEVVVVMTMISFVFLCIGTTVHLLLRTEKVVSQSVVMERTISRLGNLFRDDMHRSEKVVEIPGADGSTTELRLVAGDQERVRYRIAAGQVTREVIDDDATVMRDDFRLPDCRVRIRHERQEKAESYALLLERPRAGAQKNPESPIPLRILPIEANLNSRQWLGGGEQQGDQR